MNRKGCFMKIKFDKSLHLCREREREGWVSTNPHFKNDWGEWRLNHLSGFDE